MHWLSGPVLAQQTLSTMASAPQSCYTASRPSLNVHCIFFLTPGQDEPSPTWHNDTEILTSGWLVLELAGMYMDP